MKGEPTHHRAQLHVYTLTFTQYGQFRDANQPTTHDFRLEEETKVPREIPQSMGRTRKHHTQWTELKPQPQMFKTNMLNSEPPKKLQMFCLTILTFCVKKPDMISGRNVRNLLVYYINTIEKTQELH